MSAPRRCSRRAALAALLVAGERGATAGARDGLASASTGSAHFDDPLRWPAPPVRAPAAAPLTAIARAGTRLVAVGARGLVILSDDAGRQWRQVPLALSADLTAIGFTSPTQGWIAGHGGVLLESRDAGAGWVKRLDGNAVEAQLRAHFERLAARDDARAAALLKQLAIDHANGPEQPFLDVRFDASGRGFACGAFGLLLGSDDGGARWQSWIERIDNPRGLHLHALAEAGGSWFIASEQGTLFRLRRGDTGFAALATGHGGSFFGVLANPQRIAAFGLRGSLFESTDDGAQWRARSTGVNTTLTATAWLDDGNLALATQAGQLLVERGARFVALASAAAPMPLAGLAYADGALVAVGLAGVQRVTLH